jgi:outer membrane protein OmpA-like peptidoglycan-associated protein
MRNFVTILFILFTIPSFSQIIVELATFDREVEKSYFRGFSNVYHVKDQHNINRYYVNANGNADALVEQGRAIGLNPRIIDLAERKRLCSASCISYEELEKLQNIFFDFDKSDLRAESQRRLDLLHTILVENPEYNVEFRAHTDAKGSNEYNEGLADRRAASAESYMLSRGIPQSRLRATRYGERAPIAKNEINGQDTPAGRQLNRRVEVVVYNADGATVNLVEAIYVPAHLQN